MREIDPTARVHADAVLGDDVVIGPYSIVGPGATLGDGCRLIGNVHIMGTTSLGSGCTVHPGAVLGGPPQSIAYRGETCRLEIGANCVIREHVTIDGTATPGSATRVGANGYFMTKSHVAHDCVIGEGAIFANGATFAGHCVVGANVFASGNVMVHQFTQVGRGAILGIASVIIGDIIPFARTFGAPARLVGINVVGLKRRGCPPPSIATIRQAYRILFLSGGQLEERLQRMDEACGADPYAAEIAAFVRGPRKRPLCAARMNGGGSGESGEEGADE